MYFIASLGCYKDNICSSKISKIKFSMQILEAYQSHGRFSKNFFVINCHFGGHLVRILFLLFIWLQAKCLQLATHFIAYNLRIKMGLRHIFRITQYFTYYWLLSWTPYIEMLNDARVTSLGFFKDNVCTTRINKEKSLKSSSRFS